MFFDLDCKTGFRQKLFLSVSGFGILSLLLSSYTIGSSYYSVSGHGDWGLPGQEMVIWLCVLGIIVMAISLVGLFSNKLRCASMAVFIGCALMVTTGILSLKSADNIRINGFARLSLEAAPLVAAIQQYNEKYGYPPESLGQLEIEFPAGHVVMGGSLPEFQYVNTEGARERYHGNPWVLVLEAPTGPLRWDKFIYYPLQNYPSLGHGGWFEKVGEWAYLHD